MSIIHYRLKMVSRLLVVALAVSFAGVVLLAYPVDGEPNAAQALPVGGAGQEEIGKPVSVKGQPASGCPDPMQPFTMTLVSPKIPEDAYSSPACPDLKPPADLAARIALQRLYDLFSWRSFLAINWPVDLACDRQGCQATVKSRIADLCTTPQWAAWKESYEIFQADGSAPSPWNAPRTLPTTVDTTALAANPAVYDKNTRILYETEQANSNQPLWDQNGNRVYYEVLINKQEFDYIRANELYHLQGQIDYFQKNVLHRQEVVVFIPGSIDDTEGVIELKLAWKILTEADIAERYCTMPAYLYNHQQARWEKRTVGLVGMHIAHKTLSSTQWVWSTFAHVDNLRVNEMETLAYLKAGKTLKPSFTNVYTDGMTHPVNVLPEADAAGVRRTQVLQLLPIAPATAALNREVQELLRTQDSVWQYYELIGAQYSTDPSAPPALPSAQFPESITNRSGGKPAPVYLVNPVIETYDQEGNQEASNLVQGPLNDAKHLVFGTQSCAGCHFSAGIASRYIQVKGQKEPIFEQGTADFSWLLTRAQWQK